MRLSNKIRKLILFCFVFLQLILFKDVIAQEQTINGVISLPNSKIASTNITVEVEIGQVDRFNPIEVTNQSIGEFIISSGSNSINYSLKYVVNNVLPNRRFRIFAKCVQNCEPFSRETLFLNEDNEIVPSGVALIGPVEAPSQLDFILRETAVLSGTIRLPDNEVAQEDLILSVAVCRAETFVCSLPPLDILSGTNSVDFIVRYPLPPPESDYQVLFTCRGCESINLPELVNNFFYLQDDGSIRPGFNTISVENIPKELDFILELPEEKPFSNKTGFVPIIQLLLD